MTWSVVVEPPARRAIIRLPPRIADAAFRFLAEPLTENPTVSPNRSPANWSVT